MQVFKTFFKVAKKYKAGIIMYMAIVIGMVTMLSTLYGSDNSTKVVQKSYSLLVVDKDHSEVSEALVDYLGTKHTLKKVAYTDDQIKDMLYYQSIAEYIVIPEGFGDAFSSIRSGDAGDMTTLLDVTYDDALPRGVFINMQINEYLNGVLSFTQQGLGINEASDRTLESLDIDSFTSRIADKSNGNEKVYTAFNFLPFGILSVIFSAVLPVIISFNEVEKKNRTMISKTRMTSRNLSLVLGTVVIAFVVDTILIAIVTLTNSDAAFTKEWWLSVVNTYVYTIAITMLLSMITSLPLGIENKSTGNTSSFVTNILGLGFAFLGGTFVDLTILGDEIGRIGRFTPNYWYSTASRNIWMNNSTLSSIITDYGIQLLFGVVCLSIGLVFTKFFKERS